MEPSVRDGPDRRSLETPAGLRLEPILACGAALVVEGEVGSRAGGAIAVVGNDGQGGWVAARMEFHGRRFIAVLPNPEGRALDVYIRETPSDGAEPVLFGPVSAPVVADEAAAFKLVRDAFGPIQSVPPDVLEAVYRPLLTTPKRELAAQRFAFGPPPRTDGPVASIVVPFYGDAFFLHGMHHLQRILDERFELVLVVDDPRIWPEIYNALVLRTTTLRVPTLLLRNLGNYGFAGASNLGAGAARGDVLIFMNSDVLVTDPRPLLSAAEAIRDRRRLDQGELLLGFSLLYEDDTIQHLGMEFRRSAPYGNLYLAEHPMKGLPFRFGEGPALRPAEAVTGALMALSADLFRALDGFDRRYERGDFEDADLCLRARAAGAEIAVHIHPGLYHLERQSIPKMGGEELRGMVTYMNCAEFNHRWAERLSAPKRVFRVAQRRASA